MPFYIRFGANSPVKGVGDVVVPRLAFGEMQDRAKAMQNASPAQLLQFIEDFCREGDRVVEENKRDRVDLQKQVSFWRGFHGFGFDFCHLSMFWFLVYR